MIPKYLDDTKVSKLTEQGAIITRHVMQNKTMITAHDSILKEYTKRYNRPWIDYIPVIREMIVKTN